MSKAFTLCADDFAQSAAISESILELLAARRLTATSVFSQSPLWPTFAQQLATLSSVDVGLHFNLTHPFDDSAKPLSHWLINSQLRRLPLDWLADQIHRQIDAFTNAFGRMPDFIDGHQHVHALPQIRDALLSTLTTLSGIPYLRAPDLLRHPGDSRVKAIILKAVCHGFAQQAGTAGYQVPTWFGGVYSLSPQANYPTLMAEWLKVMPNNALLMCHPGKENAADDPIGAARFNEYQYFISSAFIESCELHDAWQKPFQRVKNIS